MKYSTLATLGEDYVMVARARGLSDRRITTAYVGRNAVLPLFTQFAISAGFILGGAVFIETDLRLPGPRPGCCKSVQQRDYPVMQGIFLLITIAVVVGNLAADLLYGSSTRASAAAEDWARSPVAVAQVAAATVGADRLAGALGEHTSISCGCCRRAGRAGSASLASCSSSCWLRRAAVRPAQHDG